MEIFALLGDINEVNLLGKVVGDVHKNLNRGFYYFYVEDEAGKHLVIATVKRFKSMESVLLAINEGISVYIHGRLVNNKSMAEKIGSNFIYFIYARDIFVFREYEDELQPKVLDNIGKFPVLVLSGDVLNVWEDERFRFILLGNKFYIFGICNMILGAILILWSLVR